MNNKSCCIEDCNSSSSREQDRGVTFHRLPRESNLRQAWVNQGRLHDKLKVNPDDENGKHTVYICSRHFRKIDFELKVDRTSKFVLKSGAIPTIFPWGITSLEDLPKIYPDVHFNAEQPEKIPTKTQSVNKSSGVEPKKSADKAKNDLVVQASVSKPSILSPVDMDKVKEYGASSDTETDKETEGNLVIDESESLQPETVTKKRKRQAIYKPLMKRTRKPKVMFGSGNTKNIPIPKLTQTNTQQTQSVEENPPGIKNKRGRKKKVLAMSPIPQGHPIKIKEPNLKANRSPMLKALIEKPNVPMVRPKTHMNLVETSEPNKEKKINLGNEKSLLVPGALVEAKDFSEQWYSAKIVEVDHDEKEVLIHYDNWSQRYDEWISMASSRLRVVGPPQKCPKIPATPVTYSPGERCMARWSNNRRFPATILAVYPNDKYKIQFDDGFVRIKKWLHLNKGSEYISKESGKQFTPLPYGIHSNLPLPPPPILPVPSPPHNHLFDPHRDHLGSKEERRNNKRKLNVKELFSRGKRRRLNQLPAGDQEVTPKKRFRRKNNTEQPIPIPESTEQPEPQISPVSLKPDLREEEISAPTSEEHRETPSNIPEPEPTISQTDMLKEQTEEISFPEEQPIISETKNLKELLAKSLTPPTPKPRISDETNNTLKQQLLSKIKMVKKPRSKPPSPAYVSFEDNQREASTTQCPPIEGEGQGQGQDLSRLLKDEWSCKWVDGCPVGEVSVLPPLERGTRAGPGEEEGPLERMSVRVEDYRLPPHWTKFLTRRCVGISSGKWDVVLMCPQGRRYRTKAEITARLLEPDGATLLPYIKCLQDFSVHRKLARRLGWDNSSFDSPETISVDALKMKTKMPKSKSLKSDYKQTKTHKYKTLEGFTKFKNTSHHSTMSKLKLKKKFYADAISKERMKLKMKMPVSAMPLESSSNDAGGSSVSSTPTELPTPSHLSQPVLEEGFIYVGSLKVQIIGTLLRCPKEGCYKNFRKDNLLQMHIKHYHPEMIDLLGSTPNVADLAYARTIVESITPVKSAEKPHRGREKKSALPATPRPELDPLALDLNFASENTFEPNFASELTPKKEPINSEVLEQSPKLRNLLLEPKSESPFKSQPHDVEDILKTFKIKQESGNSNIIKFKSEKNSSSINKPVKTKFPKAPKSDKELTKSQVMALINKIAEGGGGDRSRSQSPAEKREEKTKVFEGKAENSHGSSFHYPMKTKKKRKRLPEDSDADFKPSSGSRQKKKFSRFFHAPKALNSKNNVLATPTMNAVDNSLRSTPATEIDPQMIEPAPSELKPEDNNQTFINDNGEKIKIVHMKREEIINCYCGFGEEDGLMIQCELCLCWQHAICHGIEKESQVPDKYICHICLYPPRGRKSQRYINNQDWLYEGRLCRVEHQLNAPDPNVLNGVAPLSAADQSRAQALKKSHQLCGNLLHVAKILHSLRCKIDVSQKKDHPKLYLWSKPWDDKAQSVDNTHPHSHEEEHIKQEEPNTTSHHMEEQDHLNTQDMMDASGDFLDAQTTEEIIDSHMVGPYSELTIDEVKLEVGESIEVSEVNEMDDNGMNNVHHMEEQAGLLSSPGGTPIHLPITHMELKTLVKSVEVCAPQPEAAIDPLECRQRLLQHIENIQMLVDARLDSIEAQIAELESQDPSLADDETPESYPRTKQTMQMLIRDLQTLEELGAVAS